GAHAVGLPCVGVAYGYGGRDELEAAGAEAVVDDVPSLERACCAPGNARSTRRAGRSPARA
ncbi:MAG: hypothetical protein MSH25_08035, partial [Desulfovibrio sp.]|nr:hypothetical protein [Desulfovibrio sp.]